MIKKILNSTYGKKSVLFFKNNKPVVLSVIFLGILIDILFIKGSSDIRMFGILGIYVISIFFYKLKSRLTFLFSLILLGVMFAGFILAGTSENTEKAAVWLFFLLLIGIIQQWKETNATNK